jgi:3-isopropylmalate dehydrogenase
MYEPVHGSAPDITGQGIANPVAMLASFAMALRYSFDLGEEADLLENAIAAVFDSGLRTADVWTEGAEKLGTVAMGDAVLKQLDRLAAG